MAITKTSTVVVWQALSHAQKQQPYSRMGLLQAHYSVCRIVLRAVVNIVSNCDRLIIETVETVLKALWETMKNALQQTDTET